MRPQDVTYIIKKKKKCHVTLTRTHELEEYIKIYDTLFVYYICIATAGLFSHLLYIYNMIVTQ